MNNSVDGWLRLRPAPQVIRGEMMEANRRSNQGEGLKIVLEFDSEFEARLTLGSLTLEKDSGCPFAARLRVSAAMQTQAVPDSSPLN
jgi:hypothetical protein